MLYYKSGGSAYKRGEGEFLKSLVSDLSAYTEPMKRISEIVYV